ALGGQPGVRSARFADDLGFEAESGLSKDERNNRCLLALLDVLPGTREGASNRTARFLCALALARDGEVLLRAEGSVEGEILSAPRGNDGFGYDPLFMIPGLGLTTAQLPREQKWSVSHRGDAFRRLLKELRAWKENRKEVA
ncbi:MAG TPA: non-canonical purine NTP pyrophosphatase, partial [Acidobacteriaceae bacterium]